MKKFEQRNASKRKVTIAKIMFFKKKQKKGSNVSLKCQKYDKKINKKQFERSLKVLSLPTTPNSL